jgi:LAO/AO transport system kinase
MGLKQDVLARDRSAIARAISFIESRDSQAEMLLDELYPHTGRAHRIGVTGYPGTGKSTLINQVARAYRKRGHLVGVIAVDPSSPFSGGALLGDRIRMRDLGPDPGIFVRSMATRGAIGGLASTTIEAAHVLDAAGYDPILIETVGAGQDEIAVSLVAHTVIVVDAPGLGDDIQAIKAGLIEIAHIFVVNKADRPGADQAALVLESMLEQYDSLDRQDRDKSHWRPPVCKTKAIEGAGIDNLLSAIRAHRQHLTHSEEGQAQQLRHARVLIEEALSRALLESFLATVDPAKWEDIVERTANRQLSPLAALRELQVTSHH